VNERVADRETVADRGAEAILRMRAASAEHVKPRSEVTSRPEGSSERLHKLAEGAATRGANLRNTGDPMDTRWRLIGGIVSALALSGCGSSGAGSSGGATYSAERPAAIVALVSQGIVTAGQGMTTATPTAFSGPTSEPSRRAISASACDVHGYPSGLDETQNNSPSRPPRLPPSTRTTIEAS
jgi:hypothetical protein